MFTPNFIFCDLEPHAQFQNPVYVLLYKGDNFSVLNLWYVPKQTPSIASFCFKTLLKKLHNNGLGQMGFGISGGGIRIYMVGYNFAHATGGHIVESRIDIWSTPDVIISCTSGVLHMSSYNVHLEYSRCHHIMYIWSTPHVLIQCTSGVLVMSLYTVHLECSICQYIKYIWSTPDINL